MTWSKNSSITYYAGTHRLSTDGQIDRAIGKRQIITVVKTRNTRRGVVKTASTFSRGRGQKNQAISLRKSLGSSRSGPNGMTWKIDGKRAGSDSAIDRAIKSGRAVTVTRVKTRHGYGILGKTRTRSMTSVYSKPRPPQLTTAQRQAIARHRRRGARGRFA